MNNKEEIVAKTNIKTNDERDGSNNLSLYFLADETIALAYHDITNLSIENDKNDEEKKDYYIHTNKGVAQLIGTSLEPILLRGVILDEEDIYLEDYDEHKVDLEEVVKEDELDLKLKEIEKKSNELEEKTERLIHMENVVNELVKQFVLADNLTPEQQEMIVSQYRKIGVGDTVQPQEIVNIQGELFKMVQPVAITIYDENWLQEGSIFAPFLQSDLNGTPVVEEYKQPLGAHDAYQTGDLVSFNGKIYRAVMNNVTWSPADYPQAWELKE